MRDALRHQVLPAGCELCADQLCARNFTGFLGKQFDRGAQAVGQPTPSLLTKDGRVSHAYPRRMEFSLDNRCNLECAMCSGYFSSTIRSNREKLPPLSMMYDDAFVEQLVEFIPHLKNVNFLGGEPFLIDIYYKIWELFIELNPECEISITTNGTVYTSRVKRVLEKLNCHINVSLDSVTRESYEAIRKNAIFARTMSNLDAFSEVNRSRKKGLTISTCALVSNSRELPDIIKFANERNIRVIFNTVVFPAEHSPKSLRREEQAELVEFYLLNANATPTNQIEADNQAALEGVRKQIEFWMHVAESTQRTPLQARCAILYDTCEVNSGKSELLSDLAGNPPRSPDADSAYLNGSAHTRLVAYFTAIWEVGTLLVQEGSLESLEFDTNSLHALVRYLEQISTVQSERMYTEIRRFPREMVRLCGSLTSERLIELMDAHHSSRK